jgi:hypothetical protein
MTLTATAPTHHAKVASTAPAFDLDLADRSNIVGSGSRKAAMSQNINPAMRGMKSTELDADDSQSWRSALSSTLMDVQVSTSEDFSGSIRAQAFHGVTLNRIRAGAHRTERVQRMITADEEPCYILCVQVSGTGSVLQRGSRADLAPGDISILETHEPYELSFEGLFECLGLMIPTRVISTSQAAVRGLTAQRIRADDPLASIVSSFVGRLEFALRFLDEPTQQRLLGNAVDLTDALLADQIRIAETEAEGPATSIPREITRYIELNLADPGLSPASVARAHYMSLRKLHVSVAWSAAGTTCRAWS